MTGAESPIRITKPLVYGSESSRATTVNSTGIQGTRSRDDAVTATRGRRWRVRLARSIREFGSYGAIALILPGGSLISLCLWMLQHRTWLAARARRGLSAAWAATVRFVLPR
jgi:hypothetical protein